MCRGAEKRGNKEKKTQNNSIEMECPSVTISLYSTLQVSNEESLFCKLSTAKFSSVSLGHIESCCTLH